jgi:hypothetical protein
MSSSHITYTPHPNATPETELSALAAVYRFILFKSSASKEAAHPGGPEMARMRNAKGVSYVESCFDETSNIVHHGFAKENK